MVRLNQLRVRTGQLLIESADTVVVRVLDPSGAVLAAASLDAPHSAGANLTW